MRNGQWRQPIYCVYKVFCMTSQYYTAHNIHSHVVCGTSPFILWMSCKAIKVLTPLAWNGVRLVNLSCLQYSSSLCCNVSATPYEVRSIWKYYLETMTVIWIYVMLFESSDTFRKDFVPSKTSIFITYL
jgi:hypothetical protein